MDPMFYTINYLLHVNILLQPFSWFSLPFSPFLLLYFCIIMDTSFNNSVGIRIEKYLNGGIRLYMSSVHWVISVLYCYNPVYFFSFFDVLFSKENNPSKDTFSFSSKMIFYLWRCKTFDKFFIIFCFNNKGHFFNTRIS